MYLKDISLYFAHVHSSCSISMYFKKIRDFYVEFQNYVLCIYHDFHNTLQFFFLLQVQIERLIDLNSMSIQIGLSYTKRLENRFHGMIIFTFFVTVIFQEFFFSHGPIKYKWFLNRSIWPIDRILIGTTIPCQSKPGSNGNEGAVHTPHISRTGASRHPFLCGSYPSARGTISTL